MSHSEDMFLSFLNNFQDRYQGNIRSLDLSQKEERAGVKLKKQGRVDKKFAYFHEESVDPLSSGKWQIEQKKGEHDFSVKPIDPRANERKIVISLEDKSKDEILFSYYKDKGIVEIWVFGNKILDSKNSVEEFDHLKSLLDQICASLGC